MTWGKNRIVLIFLNVTCASSLKTLFFGICYPSTKDVLMFRLLSTNRVVFSEFNFLNTFQSDDHLQLVKTNGEGKKGEALFFCRLNAFFRIHKCDQAWPLWRSLWVNRGHLSLLTSGGVAIQPYLFILVSCTYFKGTGQRFIRRIRNKDFCTAFVGIHWFPFVLFVWESISNFVKALCSRTSSWIDMHNVWKPLD